MSATKQCTMCKKELPATPEFFVRCSARKHKDGLFTRCKGCRNDVVNKHNRARRERRVRVAGRVPGKCDVCGVALTAERSRTGAAWDHNHDTGQFRGWLCSGCNLSLGNAGDNPRVLERLALYLRERGHYARRPVIL